MKFSDSVINGYGERMQSRCGEFRGFLAPIKPDAARLVPLPNGVKDRAIYRLITNVPLTEGMEISCRGRSFEVLQTEPVYAFRLISHYEAVLRKKGGESNAGEL